MANISAWPKCSKNFVVLVRYRNYHEFSRFSIKSASSLSTSVFHFLSPASTMNSRQESMGRYAVLLNAAVFALLPARPCPSRNLVLLAAVRALEANSCSRHAEHGDVHGFCHVWPENDHETSSWGRGDDNDAVNGQRLEKPSGTSPVPGRHIDKHVINIVPTHGSKLSNNAGNDMDRAKRQGRSVKSRESRELTDMICVPLFE